MTTYRRTRSCLSIGEIDATWIWTATMNKFRFHDGHWECSINVFYGKDDGWFRWFGEPTASEEYVFIEMLPTQQFDDPEFARIISRYQKQA